MSRPPQSCVGDVTCHVCGCQLHTHNQLLWLMHVSRSASLTWLLTTSQHELNVYTNITRLKHDSRPVCLGDTLDCTLWFFASLCVNPKHLMSLWMCRYDTWLEFTKTTLQPSNNTTKIRNWPRSCIWVKHQIVPFMSLVGVAIGVSIGAQVCKPG